jgi:hypothetical protein
MNQRKTDELIADLQAKHICCQERATIYSRAIQVIQELQERFDALDVGRLQRLTLAAELACKALGLEDTVAPIAVQEAILDLKQQGKVDEICELKRRVRAIEWRVGMMHES